MNNPRKIGDLHVQEVASYLKHRVNLSNKIIGYPQETTRKTGQYILDLFPSIIRIKSKFDFPEPDQYPDLTLETSEGKYIPINLFFIKGNGRIQPKNLGALSFLEKYFLSTDLQEKFNEFFEKNYMTFLKELLKIKETVNPYLKKADIKKRIRLYYKKFTQEIIEYKNNFLYYLREYCFELLRRQFNDNKDKINHAFNKLLLTESTNIITRYKQENKCLGVEELKFHLEDGKLSVYKVGQNSLGIRVGSTSLLLRFKFESGPSSSIKLATSYDIHETRVDDKDENLSNIIEFEKLLANHQMLEDKNKSNAIGKCNEAIVYYSILKENTSCYQVDKVEYKEVFKRYAYLVPQQTIKDIIKTSREVYKDLVEYLGKKYSLYSIVSIQLVPDSYIKNRLDTSDIKLIISVNGRLEEERFSIKALAKKTNTLVSKNPGIGTILGDQYFGIGSMKEKINVVKEEFQKNQIDHQQSLEEVSNELGLKLSKASQLELKKGIQALLGDVALLISFYTHNESVLLEHGKVDSNVIVVPKFPTTINTTLYWNDNIEQLTLRVKFSANQSKGWSSIKLACQVKIDC
ncbi:hypothetical protein [Virgibacillus ndiopensis]|uniref:hypothetical protein n=1 Tax=Virgibacillus ndiopensis TaxID=2004408 RepID=UPI000C06A37F|nr:hypothetical protein [Virgibacillus ndiopensis]